MEGNKMSNIPSDEDFDRAKNYMRKIDRNIKQINKNVLQYFKKICPIHYHNFFLIAEDDIQFRAYIFYKKDKEIQEYENKGISQAIRDFIYNELERQGRGNREEIKVSFEFDSDENVKKSYDGDYFLRLH
jgi:hypothetical protein